MGQPDFNAIALEVRKHAEWVLADSDKRWHSKNSWKEDVVTPDDDPHPAPYQPTGHAALDQLVTALNPYMLYGSTPRTEVRGDWQLDRILAGLGGVKVMDDDPERVRIVMPNRADFTSEDGYCSTLTHELFHWWAEHVPSIKISQGVESKSLGGKAGNDPAYITEELSAELCSTFLLAATGVDPHIEERGEYFAGYFNAVPDKVVKGIHLRDSVFDIAKRNAIKAAKGMLAKAGAK